MVMCRDESIDKSQEEGNRTKYEIVETQVRSRRSGKCPDVDRINLGTVIPKSYGRRIMCRSKRFVVFCLKTMMVFILMRSVCTF